MIQALGWLGSALIVASLATRRQLPFRFINLVSAVVLLAFNIAISLWSMVVLNVAILAVNAWYLCRMLGADPDRSPKRRDENVGQAPPAEGWFTPSEGFRRMLDNQGSDIA